jgi:predicted glycosyltransferase involved in capsule biosynthesis
MAKYKLSVIIPYCYGGDEQRLIALENTFKSIKAQEMTDFEIIAVEELVKTDKPTFPYRDNINQFVTLKDPEKRWYNKSWCINVGIRKASTENILILDADIIFGKDYFQSILDYAQTHNFFHGYNWIVLLPGRDNPVTRIKRHRDVWATGGSFFTTKDFYWNVTGGMNENYFGYGGEDGGFYQRLLHIFNKNIPEIDYPIAHQYHHWHPDNGANPFVAKIVTELSSKESKYPAIIIEKLKQVSLGNVATPTLIDMKI